MPADLVVGLDLSYGGLGACAVPFDFASNGDVNWSRMVFKTMERQTVSIGAREILARDVRTFIRSFGGAVKSVWAEDVPRSGHQIIALAKLAAIVELDLLRDLGIELKFANQSSARLLMFGRGRAPKQLTQTERKAWVTEPLKLAGARFKSHDEADALVVANFGISELGYPCLANLLGEPEVKKRSRKAKAA